MKPVKSRVTVVEGISVLAVAVAIGGVRVEGVGGVNEAGGFTEAVVVEGIGNVDGAGVVQLRRLCRC